MLEHGSGHSGVCVCVSVCMTMTMCGPVTMSSALLFPGGFGDAGGLTSNGELPEVEPVQIKSENELKSKIAAIAKEMDLKNDWEARCKVGQS